MKRLDWAAALLVTAGLLATGCRSCQSPYDYGSPVADCACTGCTACGHGRAGSVLSGGYASGEEYYDTGTVIESVPADAEPTAAE